MSSRPDLFIRVGIDTSALQKGLNRIEKKMVRSLRRLERIGNNIQRSITLPIVAAGAASVQSAVKVDKLRKSLTGIMGNAQMANVEFQKLLKLSKNPGFTLEAAVQGSVRLQAIGYSADKARQQMEILGNAIALIGGSGQDLNGVLLAISQIIGKGKVQAEEINQIAERLPQVRKIMQEAFGTADTEAIQEMKLSAEDFIDTVVKKMGDLPKAQKSLQDTFNQMRDDLMLLGAEFGQMLIPVIMKGVEALKRLAGSWHSLDESSKMTIRNLAVGLGIGGPVLAGVSRFLLAVKDIIGKMNVWKLGLMAIVGIGIFIYRNWDSIKAAIVDATESLTKYINEHDNLRKVTESFKFGANVIWESIKTSWQKATIRMQNIPQNLKNETLKALDEAWSGKIDEHAITAVDNMVNGIDVEAAKDKMKGTLEVVESWGDGIMDVFNKLMKGANDFFGSMGGGPNEEIVSDPDAMGGFRSPLPFVDVVSHGVNEFYLLNDAIDATDKFLEKVSNNMKKNIEKPFKALEDISFQEKFAEWITGFRDFATITKDEIGKMLDVINDVFGQISSIVGQFYDNKEQRIESAFQREREAIENSTLSEEQKTARLTELDKKSDKVKRKLARDEAKRQKSAAIFQAILSTAAATIKAFELGPIAGGIAAGVISGIGAAQIAAIASQPLPALAKGGVVSGEAIVRVGEYQNASFNPEVISPLDKLKGMIGSQMSNIRIDLTGGWRVNGYELETVLESANVQRSRLTA